MTTTTAAPRRHTRALGAVGAVALGAGLVLAGPGTGVASAAETVSDGQLDWGLLASWRGYASQYQTLSGVTLSPSGTYVFPDATGTVDGDSVEASFTGSVNWTAHGGAMNITLSDLSIDIDGTTGVLTADAVAQGTVIDDAQLATLDLTGITPATGTDGTSWSGIPAEGAADLPRIFGSRYAVGMPLDPVSFVLDSEAAPPVDPEPEPPAGTQQQEIEVVVPQGSTDPEPQPGSFSWTVQGNSSAVTLGTATASGGRLVATGQIHPVVVTDTRTTAASWQVTAQVSDFDSAAGTLPGRYLGWTPNATGGGAVAGQAVASGITSGPGLSQTAVLGSAPSGHATDPATLGAALDLQLPSGTAAGTYSATLTLTALS